jgi:hypothetical protein
VNLKSARTIFGAAVALYVVWIGALVAMAIVSGARPVDRRERHTPAPAAAPASSETPNG